MYKFLNNIGIRTRTLLSVSLIVALLAFSVYHACMTLQEQIDFAHMERKGTAYLEPLIHFQGQLVKIQSAVNYQHDKKFVEDAVNEINTKFSEFEKIDSDLKADLKMTDEELAKAGKENISYNGLKKEWQRILADINAGKLTELDDDLSAYNTTLKDAIGYVGQTSNLVLDPDLDSYYLTDVSVTAAPQSIFRMASISSFAIPKLAAGQEINQESLTEFAIMARMVKEVDQDRIVGDVDVSLKEDANFYGISPTLEKNLKPANDLYVADSSKVIDMLKDMSAGHMHSPDEFAKVADAAALSAHELADTANEELSVLLDKRIDAYKEKQITTLIVAVAGIVVALLIYQLVIQSILSPLTQLLAMMKGITNNKFTSSIPYQDAKSEIGDLAKVTESFQSVLINSNEYIPQVQSLAKSQAVIQFDANGNVLNANENFLNALGYTLDEIKGRHHSMFVDPAYRETAEYKKFWEDLNRGEPQINEFRRIRKDGKDVYIQATYAPIMDVNNKLAKVVKFAIDITESKLTANDHAGQLNSLDKSQAVIEFNMDGTIVKANHNFLTVMGYTMDEIRGQHHSIFADEAYRGSPEYKEFWEKLNKGEAQFGEFKRLNKKGEPVYIQASYNPIPDIYGKPFKVVKFAVDVTAHKLAEFARMEAEQREQREKEARSQRVAQLIAEFDTNATRTVSTVASASTELSQTAEHMSQLAMDANRQSTEVASASQQASQNVQSVASAAEEMAATVQEISRQVSLSSSMVREAMQKAESADASSRELVEMSRAVGAIADLIENIAGQINLLALNATIESARSGEAGKGFAVVANEVKNLATQTAKATEQIRQQLDGVQKTAVDVADILGSVKESIGKVSESSTTIAAAVEEQSAATHEIVSNMSTATLGVEQINQGIFSIKGGTETTSASTNEVLSAAKMLSEQAEKMNSEVKSFLQQIQTA